MCLLLLPSPPPLSLVETRTLFVLPRPLFPLPRSLLVPVCLTEALAFSCKMPFFLQMLLFLYWCPMFQVLSSSFLLSRPLFVLSRPLFVKPKPLCLLPRPIFLLRSLIYFEEDPGSCRCQCFSYWCLCFLVGYMTFWFFFILTRINCYLLWIIRLSVCVSVCDRTPPKRRVQS